MVCVQLQIDAGYMGTALMGAGLFGSFIIGAIVDRNHNYKFFIVMSFWWITAGFIVLSVLLRPGEELFLHVVVVYVGSVPCAGQEELRRKLESFSVWALIVWGGGATVYFQTFRENSTAYCALSDFRHLHFFHCVWKRRWRCLSQSLKVWLFFSIPTFPSR